MTKITTSCWLLLLCILGCKHACVDNQITPAFIGFGPNDIDTFIIRKYMPNDNFLHLLDTVKVFNSNFGIYTSHNDTTMVFINSNYPTTYLSPGFDWQIYIPAKNRIISISSIESSATEGSGRVCFNPINSFVQDGQVIVPQFTTGAQYTSGYLAYINNP